MKSFKRPFPLILIADTSGSMKEHGKISSLNAAIYEMIQNLQNLQKEEEICFLLTVIGFDCGNIREFYHAADIQDIQWNTLEARGTTPLADAFLKVAEVIEQEDVVPGNSYAPILLLVSDGQPTDAKGRLSDNWQDPLETLKSAKRVNKGMRFSMAIGPDANEKMLSAFSGNGKVFHADDGKKIHEFFEMVTMATSMSLGIQVPVSSAIKTQVQEFMKTPSDTEKITKSVSAVEEHRTVTIELDDDPIL